MQEIPGFAFPHDKAPPQSFPLQRHQTPPTTPCRPGFSLNAVAYGSVMLALSGLLIFASEPSRRIGDGCEYLLMTMAICEAGQFYSDQDVAKIYETFRLSHDSSYVEMSILEEAFAPLTIDGQMDFPHFWFFSLLAAPFYLFLKLIGNDVAYCFTLLNLFLMGVGLWASHQLFARKGVVVLFTICLLSPALWFIDKGHTEFFTVVLGSVAVMCFLKDRFVESFIALAVISTQNPPFAIVGVAALIFGLTKTNFRTQLKSQPICWMGIIFGLAIAGLHPGYYYLRFGQVTPQLITGAAANDFKGIRELTCFIVDPDVGLISNWPWLLVPIFSVVFFCIWKRERISWLTFLFCTISITILCWAQAKTNNFNHGGTIKISRYALWYIPFLFPLLLKFAKQFHRVPRWQQIAVVAFLIGAAYVNTGKFWPKRPESYLFQASLAEKFYDHFPAFYDPIPEIFIERNIREEAQTQGWAVSNRTGTKIIVHSRRLKRQRRNLRRGKPVGEIIGSEKEINPERLIAYIDAQDRQIPSKSVWFYVNNADGIFETGPRDPDYVAAKPRRRK